MEWMIPNENQLWRCSDNILIAPLYPKAFCAFDFSPSSSYTLGFLLNGAVKCTHTCTILYLDYKMWQLEIEIWYQIIFYNLTIYGSVNMYCITNSKIFYKISRFVSSSGLGKL